MNFLEPWAAIGALSLPAILIFYFLKLKRKVLVVPSTYLWKKAIEDMRVNSPFQRLRSHILLILQLLLAALVVLALMRPALEEAGLKGQTTIILLDRSASMGSQKGGKSRFEQAREQARDVIDDLARGDQAMLIAFDSDAEVVGNLSDHKGSLLAALDDIKLRPKGSSIREALLTARSLLKTVPDAQIVLLSDGKFIESAQTSALELTELVGDTADLPIIFRPLTEGSDNVGITALDVRRSQLSGAFEVFSTLFNSAEVDRDVPVDLFDQKGRLLDSKLVKVAAGASRAVTFRDLNLEAGTIKLQIAQKGDALAADDVAWAVVEKRDSLNVLWVAEGPPNLFLDYSLSVDPFLKTEKMDLKASLLLTPEAISKKDVIIYDRCAPLSMPDANLLLLGVAPPLEGLVVEGEVEGPSVVDVDLTHPALRFLNFHQILIGTAQKIRKRDTDRILVDGDRAPLVFELFTPGRRALLLSFNPMDSDWVWHGSFPIFIANICRWLAGLEEASSSRKIQAFQPIEFPVDSSLEELSLRAPDGESRSVPIKQPGRFRYDETDQLGIWEVEEHSKISGSPYFAVNLLDLVESDVRPSDSLVLQGQKVSTRNADSTGNREIWKELALVALAVLLLEWYVYHKKVFI